MPLSGFGDCFKLHVSNEVMPYEIYAYEHVSMGVRCMQDALDALKTHLGKKQC